MGAPDKVRRRRIVPSTPKPPPYAPKTPLPPPAPATEPAQPAAVPA